MIEFLNDKYDPFDFHLSGWNEHLTKEVDTWDDVFEELYEKYKHVGRKLAPEIRLIYMLIMSGCAFHFTKSIMNPSNISSLLSKPELLSGLFNNLSKPNKSTISSSQKVNDLLKTYNPKSMPKKIDKNNTTIESTTSIEYKKKNTKKSKGIVIR